MSMTPEKKVKNKAVVQLKTLGTYYFYPVTSGYGASGVPDIVGCYRGIMFGIECKANGNKPTKLQEMHLAEITKNGGISMVVDETTVESLADTLRRIVEGYLLADHSI
jgi:hypothetical protein